MTITKSSILELYTAYFNRAADATGLAFWENIFSCRLLTSGLTAAGKLERIASDMTNSPEYQTLYPANLSNRDLMSKIYQNVLNREADNEGLIFWTNHLDTKSFTPAQAVIQIVNAAKINSSPQGLLDAAYLTNTTDISDYFAKTLISDDVESAKQAFNRITADPSSVESTKVSLGPPPKKLPEPLIVDDYRADFGTTAVVPIGGSLSGNLETVTDTDWFKLELNLGESYIISTLASSEVVNAAGWSIIISLYDETGEYESGFTNAFQFDSNPVAIGVTPSVSGIYYLEVAHTPNIVAKPGCYLVSVAPSDTVDDYLNTIKTTGVLTTNSSVSATHEIKTDEDWFELDLVAETPYLLTATTESEEFYELEIRLIGENGSIFEEAEQVQFNPKVSIEFKPTDSGKYYFSVMNRYRTGDYEVNLEVIGSSNRTLSDSVDGDAFIL